MIYMIRHGQASFGNDNYDKLSKKGILQSTILGKHLVNTGIIFDAVYSGPLIRQQATASLVLNSFRKENLSFPDVTVMQEFEEYDPTAVLMSQIPLVLKEDPSLQPYAELIYKNSKAFQKIFEKALLKWVSGTNDSPGVETWESLKLRVKKGIEHIMKTQGSGKNIAVFTSGGPISATMHLCLGLTNENAIKLNWQVINASISRFMYNPERITLAGFNNISHIELTTDKTLITYR